MALSSLHFRTSCNIDDCFRVQQEYLTCLQGQTDGGDQGGGMNWRYKISNCRAFPFKPISADDQIDVQVFPDQALIMEILSESWI